MGSLATPTTPRKLPRQERSRALVEAILDAAARILIKRGRDAVTTNSVAVLAGVSIGSLYQYFPNREAILAAVAERHAHRIHHRVADIDLRGATTLAAAVTRIVAALFAAHQLDPALHLALDPDLAGHAHGHGHHHDHRNDHQKDDAHDHSGTKPAIVRLLTGLPDALRAEIASNDIALSAEVVAEIVHALAHAAMHPAKRDTPGPFEAAAVRAALAYLRTPD